MSQFIIRGLRYNNESEEFEEVEKEIECDCYETAYDYAYNYFDKAVHGVTEV